MAKPLEEKVCFIDDEEFKVVPAVGRDDGYTHEFFLRYHNHIGGQHQVRMNVYRIYYACADCEDIFMRKGDHRVSSKDAFKYFESHSLCPQCIDKNGLKRKY